MNRIARDIIKQSLILLLWLGLYSWFDKLVVLASGKVASRQGGVLLVKRDAIGDFFLALPVVAALVREAEKADKPVLLICDARNASLARAFFPQVDVFALDIWRFVLRPLYRAAVLRKVRAYRPSLAVNLELSRDLLWGDSVVRVCGALLRQSVRGYADRVAGCMLPLCDGWYTHSVAMRSKGGFEAEVLRNGMMDLGHAVDVMEPPSINLSPQDQAKVPGYPYYVLGPGSLRPIKLWPPERFGQLALAIWQKCGLKAILIGAPSDEEVGGVVVQVAGAAVTNFIGRTTLKEALAVIRKSSLLIANDSALVHMAGYLGVPSVALLGGGYVGRFLPYPESANWLAPVRAVMKTMPCFHCEWRCRYPIGNQLTAPCIAQIEVSDVMRAAADLLPTSSSPRK